MYAFLDSMASRLGYSVSREERAIHDTRFDMRWKGRAGNDEIMLEHENEYKGVAKTGGELQKLLDVNSPLRVLVTYLPPYLFRQQEQLADRVLSELKERSKAGELLLVLGTSAREKPTDWMAWRFALSFQKEPLFLPYLNPKAPGEKSWLAKPLSFQFPKQEN